MPHQPIVIDTLGALRKYGYSLSATCDGCRRWRRLDLDALIAKLGAGYRFVPAPERLNPLLRCSECGWKGATVQIASPPKEG